ncbi:MAG TPA: indole-3-glycerol phosphate synthase TrpC [Candidatus Hydrogenedentes bacterium]|nr:indole-3-glycerol phosphate synthase TrpC [Candidatus Hydrogenedentota bacterium]
MILDEIIRWKHQEIAEKKRQVPISELEAALSTVSDVRDFASALRKPGITLIAEFKRRSPSRGEIMPDGDPASVARMYQQAGAEALSILTDQKYFGGSMEDLTRARDSVSLPCLRKEFIIDPYQVYEARVGGADAILLIVRVLEEKTLRELLAVTRSLGMAALVETHTETEVLQALDAGADIIGINNRDLDTLSIDLETTMRLRPLVPGNVLLVSESGIRTRQDVQRLEDGGVDAILVGESILTSGNPEKMIRKLLGHDTD